ncbi:hypothetical protein [Nocardia tengchongensis]|uniref:hypothetical protein n=1 Tax=Nocardia tengchongensis TaxID=2055889 RepID=UPI0036BA6186
MSHRFIRLFGAGFCTAATALGVSLVAPAHADVSGNGMSLPGSAFQVGQTYSFTVKTTPPPSTGAPSFYVMDAAGGVITVGFNRSSPDASGTVSLNWTPAFGGTHQVYVVDNTELPPTNSGIPAPPSGALYGPVTVQVTGTPTAPTVCTPNQACMTVTGTPEVGCPLTLGFVGYPSNIRAAEGGLQSGSAQLPTAAPHWPDGTTQNEIEFADSDVMIGSLTRTDGATASVQWTPTTSGFHRLEASIVMPPGPTTIGHTVSADSGLMYLPVAAAGTTACGN